MRRRIRLGVIFGGESGEHEVSVSSARAVIAAVDPERFEVVPIGITKGGAWRLGQGPSLLGSSEVPKDAPESVELVADVARRGLVPAPRGNLDSQTSAVDVVFPLLHGPFGEDGTVQGLLELARVPYVGAGVAASAVGMDKALMKAMFEHAGLPVPRYLVFMKRDWEAQPSSVLSRVQADLNLPVFVKPCRLGSSVGITKARTADELWASMAEAMSHDNKVIVEEMIPGREIECGLLGNHDPAVSPFGEVITKREFYDYEAKYTEGQADLIIPARLTTEEVRELTVIARKAFAAIDAEGMARVDFFIRRPDGKIILNEINTIPGFAPTSMYPKLWEASGLGYGELVERLVDLALEREAERHGRSSLEGRDLPWNPPP